MQRGSSSSSPISWFFFYCSFCYPCSKADMLLFLISKFPPLLLNSAPPFFSTRNIWLFPFALYFHNLTCPSHSCSHLTPWPFLFSMPSLFPRPSLMMPLLLFLIQLDALKNNNLFIFFPSVFSLDFALFFITISIHRITCILSSSSLTSSSFPSYPRSLLLSTLSPLLQACGRRQ